MEADSSRYGPIRVESFWGAVAMFCLCQIYFFILFEGFVYFSKSKDWRILVWFGILFFVSVGAQVEVMVKINDFFSGKRFSKNVLFLRSLEDFIKCLLAFGLGVVFIIFWLGYYPFPSEPHKWQHTLLFYVLIWIMSYGAASNLKKGIQSKQPLGIMNLLPTIMGLAFFAAGAFLGDIFYFVGTFGLGFALIPIRPLLLCNQTKKGAGEIIQEEY